MLKPRGVQRKIPSFSSVDSRLALLIYAQKVIYLGSKRVIFGFTATCVPLVYSRVLIHYIDNLCIEANLCNEA